MRGDLTVPDALIRAARSSDGVIHAGGTRGPEAATVDRGAVSALLDGLRGSDRPFVYTSGAFVYGETGTTPVSEDHPLSPMSLMAWRHVVEQQVLDAAHGVRSVVVRVPMVYGRGGSLIVPRWLAAARQDGVAHYVGSGTALWSSVHIDDLANLYLRALAAAPAGSVFNAVTGEPVRLDALAAAIARAAGLDGRTASWSVEEAAASFGPYARGFTENQVLSAARAEQLLGWRASGPPVLEDIVHGSYREAAATPPH